VITTFAALCLAGDSYTEDIKILRSKQSALCGLSYCSSFSSDSFTRMMKKIMIWGPGVGKGIDLYDINQSTRKDPGDGRPKYARSNQPIRNGDLGNLALKMLGLPHIPGSFMNNKQDLQVK